MLPGSPGRSLAQGAHPVCHELDELVVDRLLDVHPLGRDAGLAGVLHRVVNGGIGGALEIGVRADDHRVLAAQLERDRRERSGGALHHLLPGGGGAGEHDEVDLVDQRRAGVAVPGCDLVDAVRETALTQPLAHQHRRERRDLAGLDDHRVARRQRGDRVADGGAEWIVPGGDDADHPHGRVAHGQLAALDERRGGLDLLLGEVLLGVLGPEAERARDEGDLGEVRLLPRLAGLRNDRLDLALAVVDHPLLGALQDLGATLEAERLPARLGGAGRGDELGDALGGDDVHDRHHLAGCRILDLDLRRGRTCAIGLNLGCGGR